MGNAENAENFGVVAEFSCLRVLAISSIAAPKFTAKTEGTEISVGGMGGGPAGILERG